MTRHTTTVDDSEEDRSIPVFKDEAVEQEVSDLSMTLGEMDLLEEADISFEPHSSTTSSSQENLSGSTSSAEDNQEGWAERKWIVNESHIMKLFTTCNICSVGITQKQKAISGSRLKITWTCHNGHTGFWDTCPETRNMADSNLLISAGILFTGATYTDIAEWAELLNVQIPKKTTFYALQSTYLIPVIHYAYREQQDKLMQRLIQQSRLGQKIEVCGDARSDSPGFSAKYSTYSFQDDGTKEVVHFELVEVTEANSSVAMEVMGFERGLDHLMSLGVDVGLITTDRSPSIRKLMASEKYKDKIQHEFDAWHVGKSVKKKIVSVSNKKANADLLPWLKSISNHLYWSCESCGGDPEECVRRWKSLLHHICGVHRWEEEGVEFSCMHQHLTEEEQKRKKWLKADSSAFHALRTIVMDPNILRDLKQMSHFKHTGSLEVFHSSMLKYTPKRLHFRYESMLARTQLAVIDHNANVGREQATSNTGQLMYKYVWSKPSRDWVAKPVKEKTKQMPFRCDLVERVIQRRADPSVVFTQPLEQRRRRRLLHNIAPVPRPDKEELRAKSSARFSHSTT